ncbi:YncE family protein [Actinoplanes sp. NPDC051851]|uniref:YncE family protein n=1 Tax=Actinoplanes sp. NPDC051851 TaxID=3154753 RepID=UPI003432A01B
MPVISRRVSRTVAVVAAAAASSAFALPGVALAHSAAVKTASVQSAAVLKGQYQSAYSQRNKALWVTTAVGRTATPSAIYKLDPKTLAVEGVINPPVLDATTGAVEGVYGIAVDDEYNRLWVTNTRNNTVAVYSQKTGEHLATLPDVAHAREIVVDEKHNTVWASAFGAATLVAYDSRTLTEKKRITVTGSSPTGLAVDEKSGTLYATDLAGDQIIEVTRKSDTPALIPVGDGPISVALSSDGRFAYTANQTAGTVSVVDTKKDAVVATYTAGAGALSVAYEERSKTVLVANRTAASVSVIDARTGTVEETIATTANPNHIEAANGYAYLVDKSGAGAAGEDYLYKIKPAN